MEKSVKVDILDENDKVLRTYTIDKLTIASNTRRLALTAPIFDSDNDEITKSQMMMCAGLACTLRNGNDKLMFPDDDGAQQCFENLDLEEYGLLSQIFMEINPPQNTLKAKKKKS